MEKIYTKRFRVHTYEVDFRAKALPLSLLNYLQDAAGEHADALGFSLLELLKKKQTWLLSRYHLKVFRYPVIGEELTVSTWPSGTRGVFALRDYEMWDEKGGPVAAATSSWVLWNLAEKQPSRLDGRWAEEFVLDQRAVSDPFATLPSLESPERELAFRVEMHDIDINSHVNYAVYIRWALESVPEKILRSHAPSEIEVAYRAEAFYGDEVLSRSGRAEGEPRPVFRHAVFHKEKGTELARLTTAWAPFM